MIGQMIGVKYRPSEAILNSRYLSRFRAELSREDISDEDIRRNEGGLRQDSGGRLCSAGAARLVDLEII